MLLHKASDPNHFAKNQMLSYYKTTWDRLGAASCPRLGLTGLISLYQPTFPGNPKENTKSLLFLPGHGHRQPRAGPDPRDPPSTPIPTARHPLRGHFRAAAINYGKSPRMPSGSCWKLKRNRIYVPINRYLHTQPYCTANSPTGAWGKPHEAGPRRFAGQDWRQSRKHRAGELSCGG